MSDLADRIESLSPAKRALLERRLAQARARAYAPARATSISAGIPHSDEPDAPLSFPQEGMWLLQQLDPASGAYNRPSNLKLTGPLDVNALRGALDQIIRRHEALRTVFRSESGGIVQSVLPWRPLELPITDLSMLPPQDRRQRSDELSAEEAARPFDVSRDPLCRAKLVRLAPNEHLLLLTIHHIVFDGWSMQLLLGELRMIYDALRRGETALLPELPIQYGDFSRWQRAREPATAEAVDWWRRALDGAPTALDLPLDRPRPAVSSLRGQRVVRMLPIGLVEPLKAIGQRHGATLFMVLLAGYKAMLHRCRGQEDLLLATPVAGRVHVDTERLIGAFLNTVLIRTHLHGDPTFGELVERVRRAALEAFAHAEAPILKVVSAIRPRSPGQQSLFHAMFQLRNLPRADASNGELRIEEAPTESGAVLDLATDVLQCPDGLLCAAQYSTDVFDRATVERMLDLYERILAAIVECEQLRLSQLAKWENASAPQEREGTTARLLRSARAVLPEEALLSLSARRLIAEIGGAWNGADGPTVVELFEEQARRRPDHPAVEDTRQTLSYSQLNARAEGIAQHLMRRGAGPETLVGLCAGRSVGMLAGILGILKAGAAYVPLDPAYPPARLAAMLEDCQLVAIVGEDELMAKLPANAVAQVRLDTDDESAGSAPRLAAKPFNLAYVMFTSGSTGRPKGVMVEHRSLANFVGAMSRCTGLNESDRVLQFCSISFDASVEEIFPALCAGATVVLRDESIMDSPADFFSQCAQRQVSIASLPTGWWHELAGAVGRDGVEVPGSLRVVLIGGERALPGPVQRWRQHAPAARLINTYGPTEATVEVTAHDLSADDDSEVPIGRALDGVELHVLDDGRRPAAAGEPGELYIGGACLARGYLNQPVLTAERFVGHPLSRDPAARLYRTGDRVRRRVDGALLYLGRIDEQVKIRGFRVEPAEIEQALLQDGRVAQAAVVPVEEQGGTLRLAAFVVTRDGQDVGVEQLRDFLAERLPDYMVPGTIALVDALPVTPGGKIDRNALRAAAGVPVSEAGSPGADGSESLRTPTEQIIAGIWMQVLCVGSVERGRSFFDLGGHSLLATQVLSRIRTALGVQVSLRAFFDAPTVEGLAGIVQRLRRAPAGEDEPRAGMRGMRGMGEPPLSFAQQRLWFVEQLEPGRAAYNVPVVLMLHGEVDQALLQQAATVLCGRHEALRSAFPEIDGRPVLRSAPPGPVRFEVDELSCGEDPAGDAVRAWAARHAAEPFNLAEAPLLRWRLARLGEHRIALLLVAHHIICDGWSLEVMFRELGEIYAALHEGRQPVLADPPLQYPDFAAWQRRWLEGEPMRAEVGWWTERLRGAPALLALPTDRPRPAVQMYRGQRESLELDSGVSAGIDGLAREEGATAYMVLLAAFAAVLQRLSGQEDLTIGTPLAGRNWTATESAVGLFVNMLALRIDLSGQPAFRELLGRVREACLSAHDHPHCPMEKIVEQLRPERSLAHTPLFQVMFNMINTRPLKLSIGGLRAEFVGDLEHESKFDLTLYVKQREGGYRLESLYNADLFDRSRMGQLLRQIESLLRQVLADAQRPVGGCSLTNETTRTLLPDPTAELDGKYAGTVPGRWAEVAATNPAGVAIEDAAGSWTYGHVDDLSGRLASALEQAGVGREDVVAILGHRSAALVVAMLGIWRAGAALLVLDPAHPGPRLAQMVRSARPRAWIAIESAGAPPAELAEELDRQGLRLRITLPAQQSALREALQQHSLHGGGDAPAADDLAYVMFTSGTTGGPRGIAGAHRPVAHFLDWQARRFNLARTDRFSLLSGLSHDILLRDVFAPLWSGGTLCIPDPERMREPGWLANWMQGSGITVAHLTPAMGRLLCGAAEARLPNLRMAFFAGEILTGADVRALRAIAPAATAVNFYGATETPQAMGHYVIKPGATVDEGTICVGSGIADVQLLVLNRFGKLAGVGELGEVCIRTPYLARGYLNEPALTAQRFTVNSAMADSADRVYRTGDLGRYRPDGALEVVGRDDQQVKIRGYRIEPAEVETALCAHPAVRQAAVTVRGEGDERRLVAFIVPAGECSVGELRTHLRRRLPEPMVPSALTLVPALPLTPNGKIDRQRLAQMAIDAPTPSTAPDKQLRPRTLVEAQVAAAFEEVLGVESVGLRDDFFDLGGHSLLAVQLVHRLRQRCGLSLPVAALFSGGTVEHLAAELERNAPENRRAWQMVQRGEPGVRPVFWVHGDVYGAGMYCSGLARRLGPRQPFYAIGPLGFDEWPPPRTIAGMARRFLQDLRAMQPKGPYRLGGFCNGGLIAYEMARMLAADGERIELLAVIRAGAGLVRWPGVHRATHDLGRLLGLDEERRLDLFLRIREQLAGWAHVSQRGAGAGAAYIADRLRRLPRKLLARLTRTARGGANLPSAVPPPQTRAHAVMTLHRRAMLGYLPGRYAGRIHVFWPAEEGHLLRGDPAAGWRKFAAEVVAHRIAGGHLTCVTTHVESVAAQLAQCIAECDGAQRD